MFNVIMILNSIGLQVTKVSKKLQVGNKYDVQRNVDVTEMYVSVL